jgi:predicted O-methyltransferase YrrM
MGSSLDIKWRNRLTLRSLWDRPYRHLTPSYVFHRVKHAAHRKMRPTDPNLTEASIQLLAMMLTSNDVGAEWGAGNSTGWFAKRTAHLTSFENNPDYVPVVRQNLIDQGIQNVDLRQLYSGWMDDEEAMHKSDWVGSVDTFKDSSLDYALVDSAPRGCVCRKLVTKIKPGGLLILDNADWYMPPPKDLRPWPVGSVDVVLGLPNSTQPKNICWPHFFEATSSWRKIWTSNAIGATLIMVRT